MALVTHVENNQTDLEVDVAQIPPLVAAVLQLEGVRADEVSILLANPDQMCQIHGDHFDDPTITDCMSFPLDDQGEDYRLLGDVVACPKVAVDYGGDPYEELSLYLVHGILHLLGYNDIEEEETAQMRRAEQRHLSNLRSNQALLTPP